VCRTHKHTPMRPPLCSSFPPSPASLLLPLLAAAAAAAGTKQNETSRRGTANKGERQGKAGRERGSSGAERGWVVLTISPCAATPVCTVLRYQGTRVAAAGGASR
jgi:hypothetical protein